MVKTQYSSCCPSNKVKDVGYFSKRNLKIETHKIIIVSPAKQKRDICIAFPALSFSSAA